LLPLSQCYEYGLGCKADMKLAFEMTEKAAKDDHPSGQFRMGQFLQRGLGCEVNEMESKKWLNRAAKQHHRFAIEALKKE
jgi:TPR repeat protein